MTKATILIGAFTALWWTSTARAGLTPAAKCEALKNQQAGKYAFCLETAEMKLLKTKGMCSVSSTTQCYLDTDCPSGETCTKDQTKYDEMVSKCNTKFTDDWAKLETKAAGTCPTSGDQGTVQTAVTDSASCFTGNLTGGPQVSCDPIACNSNLTAYEGYYSSCETSLNTCDGNLNTCQTNLSACYTDCASSALDACQANLATCQAQGGAQPPAQLLQTGQTLCWDGNGYVIACAGTGQDGALQAGSALSYTDNGDGTITDAKTGLMWEKKVARDGTPDATNLHDADNCFPWSGTCGGPAGEACATDADCGANGPCEAADCQTAAPNGLTIFKWVAQLNAATFAGHNDWRIPNIRELQSLVDYGAGNPAVAPAFNGVNCGSSCTDITSPACSCTGGLYYYYYYYASYWSSTSYQLSASYAWVVAFYDGDNTYGGKGNNYLVRAVRGGS